jgi:hypothetical protein
MGSSLLDQRYERPAPRHVLGSGTFACVTAAVCRATGERVALKKLRCATEAETERAPPGSQQRPRAGPSPGAGLGRGGPLLCAAAEEGLSSAAGAALPAAGVTLQALREVKVLQVCVGVDVYVCMCVGGEGSRGEGAGGQGAAGGGGRGRGGRGRWAALQLL